MSRFLKFSSQSGANTQTINPEPTQLDEHRRFKRLWSSERGTALFLGTCALAFLVPLTGLAVDVGYLYACKSNLQAAVDGSALAAARALNLGITPALQATQSVQNAKNWFYSNFPVGAGGSSAGNWGTTNTVMDSSTITIDDITVPQLRQITVSASTKVPTYFMKWFNFSSTQISAVGKASRRDLVVMIVLDRSSSMQLATGGNACPTMQLAAKLFTAQFANGRDRIGLISFSDGTYLHSSPTQTFDTTLGYNDGTDHSGVIDNISCNGGTNTAQAITLAEDELKKINLPGALNVILFESDGLPNSLTMRFGQTVVTNAATTPPTVKYESAMANLGSSSGCQDANGRRKGSSTAGWASGTATPYTEKLWFSTAHSFGIGSGLTAVPASAYGVLYVSDTSNTNPWLALGNPWQTDGSHGLGSTHLDQANTPGCTFNVATTTPPTSAISAVTDFDWLPPTDVFGNLLNPPTNPYKSVIMETAVSPFPAHVRFRSSDSDTTKRANFRDAAFNAADYAAYRARTDATIPATFYVIGLGGFTGAPPDKTLMQRIANDNRGDEFNPAPGAYSACTNTNSAAVGQCLYYDSQPLGKFIYSTDQGDLKKAFVELSSQILRLSR